MIIRKIFKNVYEMVFKMPLCLENFTMELCSYLSSSIHLLLHGDVFLFLACFLSILVDVYGKPHIYGKTCNIFPSKITLYGSKTYQTCISCFSCCNFHGYRQAILTILTIAHAKIITFSKTTAPTLNFKDVAQFCRVILISINLPVEELVLWRGKSMIKFITKNGNVVTHLIFLIFLSGRILPKN